MKFIAFPLDSNDPSYSYGNDTITINIDSVCVVTPFDSYRCKLHLVNGEQFIVAQPIKIVLDILNGTAG